MRDLINYAKRNGFQVTEVVDTTFVALPQLGYTFSVERADEVIDVQTSETNTCIFYNNLTDEFWLGTNGLSDMVYNVTGELGAGVEHFKDWKCYHGQLVADWHVYEQDESYHTGTYCFCTTGMSSAPRLKDFYKLILLTTGFDMEKDGHAILSEDTYCYIEVWVQRVQGKLRVQRAQYTRCQEVMQNVCYKNNKCTTELFNRDELQDFQFSGREIYQEAVKKSGIAKWHNTELLIDVDNPMLDTAGNVLTARGTGEMVRSFQYLKDKSNYWFDLKAPLMVFTHDGVRVQIPIYYTDSVGNDVVHIFLTLEEAGIQRTEH